MSEINQFKKFILYSGDVTADVDQLHIKRIHLEPFVGHLYIVREDINIYFVLDFIHTQNAKQNNCSSIFVVAIFLIGTVETKTHLGLFVWASCQLLDPESWKPKQTGSF
jgi:hypothetical protein